MDESLGCVGEFSGPFLTYLSSASYFVLACLCTPTFGPVCTTCGWMDQYPPTAIRMVNTCSHFILNEMGFNTREQLSGKFPADQPSY